MEKNLDQIVVAAVSETLENMAFMEVVHDESLEAEAADETLTAGLLSHEPVPGELRLTMPHSLLAKVAEAAYALPAESLEEQILKDLLAELLNTVSGRFLTLLLPPDQNYRLGLPEIDGESALLPEAAERSWHFRMDGEPFTLKIRGEALVLPRG